MALTDKLASIADAIREVGGTTAKLTPAEMPDAIAKLGESDYPTLVMYQGQPFTLTADLAKADGAAWEMPSTDTLSLHMWHGADALDASGNTATLSMDVPADAVLKVWHWTLVLSHGGTEYMVALGDAECRADGKAKERRVDGFVDKCREVKSGQGGVSKWFAYVDAARVQVTNYGNQNAVMRAARYPACTSVGGYAFFGCASLASVELPACTSVGGSGFNGCASLVSVELPACTTLSKESFAYCSRIKELVLPGDEMCVLTGGSCFYGCVSTNDGTLRIYVADALVDEYKSATNWSGYAKYIYPISERPEKTPDAPDAPTGWDD